MLHLAAETTDSSGQWAPYLAAAAALLAAIFTGLNLLRTEQREKLNVIRTEQRERLSWRRSALQSAFVDFLTASYNHKTACERILRRRLTPTTQTPADNEDRIADHARRAEDAHQVMLDCASRLRLLSSDQTAEMALSLWHVTKAWMQMLEHGRYDELHESSESRDLAFQSQRDKFIARAQELLGVDI